MDTGCFESENRQLPVGFDQVWYQPGEFDISLRLVSNQSNTSIRRVERNVCAGLICEKLFLNQRGQKWIKNAVCVQE